MTRRVLVAVAVLAVGVLGGCGGDDGTGTTAPTAGGPVASAPPPAGAAATTTTGANTTSSAPAPVPGSAQVVGGGTAAAAEVTMQSSKYRPDSVRVSPGQVVKFTNGDGYAHTVTADNKAFDTGAAPGEAFGILFSAPGTYSYLCEIHGRGIMSGTVTVG